MAKKRANGEGSIRKRKDGRWEGRYTAGHDPETGKAIYKNVLGRTQAEVKEKLRAAIKETQSLDLTKAGKYTMGEWMEVWFEDYAKIKVRPSSHQTYRGYIDNHINPNIGDIPLEKLTSLDLQKLYKKLLIKGRVDRLEAKGQPKGLSAKTVRNIHQILSSALKLAQEQRIILTNPAEGCALPKVEHREMKTLPVEQLQSFLREARESGVFELYYLELATGLRRGELLSSGVVRYLEDGIEEKRTYCDFSGEHWPGICPNIVIERLNQMIHRRTCVESFLDGNSALMLLCAWLCHVAGTQWGNKRCMNMKHLRPPLKPPALLADFIHTKA